MGWTRVLVRPSQSSPSVRAERREQQASRPASSLNARQSEESGRRRRSKKIRSASREGDNGVLGELEAASRVEGRIVLESCEDLKGREGAVQLLGGRVTQQKVLAAAWSLGRPLYTEHLDHHHLAHSQHVSRRSTVVWAHYGLLMSSLN